MIQLVFVCTQHAHLINEKFAEQFDKKIFIPGHIKKCDKSKFFSLAQFHRLVPVNPKYQLNNVSQPNNSYSAGVVGPFEDSFGYSSSTITTKTTKYKLKKKNHLLKLWQKILKVKII